MARTIRKDARLGAVLKRMGCAIKDSPFFNSNGRRTRRDKLVATFRKEQ